MSNYGRNRKNDPNPPLHGYLPFHVRRADISAMARILYSEIAGMTIKTGYCYASNSYFAEVFDVSERMVRSWIKELCDINAVRSTYDQTRRKHERRIHLVDYSDNELDCMNDIPTGNKTSRASEV